ncbi:MAG TPA: L,D-transpeptidase [Candidatus Cloacimonadota bacterium]|nr:L,D-transpeptidase [Candidatus Cloacimonadota bacterium]
MKKVKKVEIVVCIKKQTLSVWLNGEQFREYPVSTSKYGVGNKAGSYKTPLGLHRVCEKIGKDEPIGTIFKGKKSTGNVLGDDAELFQGQHLITSRIIRLEGLEEGINKGQGIDSTKRYIWIHGTSDEGMIGKPASHGCIRLKNEHVLEFFDLVKVGTEVNIVR